MIDKANGNYYAYAPDVAGCAARSNLRGRADLTVRRVGSLQQVHSSQAFYLDAVHFKLST
jgi:hypothetical protein